MADNAQFLRLLPLAYNPDNDIPKTHPGKTPRYVEEITNATRRIDVLIESLPLDKCIASTAIEFLLSVRHYLHMFMTIVSAIENPDEFVRAAISQIKAIEKISHVKMRNIPDNGAGVPTTSFYELALRVIAENCRRENKAMAPKDLMENIIAQVKLLYSKLEPAAAQSSAPRTIAFCIAGKEPDELSVSVPTSKDIWIPASFLQKWVLATRAARFGEKGVQACKDVILEVDKMINLSNDNRNIEVLRLAASGYVARNLQSLEAQAFDGKTFAERDRCWRCRLTFRFAWMSEEADPNKEPENKVRDFEGRWQASHSSETGNLNSECGKCAEYLLWLELSPELIPLPEDDELLELSQEASHASFTPHASFAPHASFSPHARREEATEKARARRGTE